MIPYIKVAAVKKLVVGFLLGTTWSAQIWLALGIFVENVLHFTLCCLMQDLFSERIRVFQAGIRLEYLL
jgi:hypothetical protein